MKTLLLLIMALVSSNGFSGVGGSIGGSGGGAFKLSKRLVTLEDFDNSLAYIVDWPTIGFEDQMASVLAPVKNVCFDGEIIKTIKPIKVCTKMDVIEICTKNGSRDANEYCRAVKKGEIVKESFYNRLVMGCVSTIEKSFERSKFHQVDICTNWKTVSVNNSARWECIEYGKQTKEYPESYKVSVTTRKKSTIEEVANLDFTIPECK